MLISFSDGLWRVLTVLSLGLMPSSAPLEMHLSPSPDAALVRLVLGLLICAAMVLVIRWMTPRSPLAVGLWWSSIFVAAVYSVALLDQGGPLSRSVWAMAPLVWASLGAFLGHLTAALVRSLNAKRGAVVASAAAVGLVIGIAAVSTARARFGSREQMWQAVLASEPSHQAAAVGYFHYLRQQGQGAKGREVLRACVDANPASCRCIEEAAQDALDRLAPRDALDWLDKGREACGESVTAQGLRAEALVASGQYDVGEAQTRALLADDDENPQAVLALGNLAFARGDLSEALSMAKRASRRGRCNGGRLLEARVLVEQGDFTHAAHLFSQILTVDPAHVAALTGLAVALQHTGRIDEAREHLSTALHIEPQNFGARYQLVLLEQRAGRATEAREQLKALVHEHPRDPRLAPLIEQLGPSSP